MTESQLNNLVDSQFNLIQQLYFSKEDSFQLFLNFIDTYSGDLHQKVCENIKLMTNCEFSKEIFIANRSEIVDYLVNLV